MNFNKICNHIKINIIILIFKSYYRNITSYRNWLYYNTHINRNWIFTICYICSILNLNAAKRLITPYTVRDIRYTRFETNRDISASWSDQWCGVWAQKRNPEMHSKCWETSRASSNRFILIRTRELKITRHRGYFH